MAKAITASLKRKNIDLPLETLQKLSMLAVANGKSLKSYIENLLIAKANSVSIEVKPNPSPSDDTWFMIPENLQSLQKGMAEKENGAGKAYTISEIKDKFGL